jgi:hypothetical protein
MRITHDTPSTPSAFTIVYAEQGAIFTTERIQAGLQFRCIRYREQVTVDACRMAEWELCKECATGARLRK